MTVISERPLSSDRVQEIERECGVQITVLEALATKFLYSIDFDQDSGLTIETSKDVVDALMVTLA
jgi:hypothetical protein